MIPGYLLRFLSRALWRQPCRVFAARTYVPTYRAALDFITSNSQSLSMLERAHAIALFDCLQFEDVADHAANGEHIQGLEQFVLCGGLSAFSGVHYFICATADGLDQSTRQMIVITEFCTSLLDRLGMQYISDSVEKRLKEWCVQDCTASDGMAASFYALFDTPNDPRTPDLDSKYHAISTNAGMYWVLVRSRAPATTTELFLRYPCPAGALLQVDETWLSKYLHAVRAFKSPGLLHSAVEILRTDKAHIPWAAALVQQLTAAATTNKQQARCALPGCGLTSETVLCPLRKCGRCLSTYYCGESHQRQHWPEHKKSCRKQNAVDRGEGSERVGDAVST
jgi:uncharacterized protein CbrC (UPF0167 family)